MAKYADITPFYEWLEDLMRMDDSKYSDYQTLMFYEIIDKLDSLPEVVRCKDSKHLVLTEEGLHNPNDCVCDYWMTDGLNDFDFCSYGERKGND